MGAGQSHKPCPIPAPLSPAADMTALRWKFKAPSKLAVYVAPASVGATVCTLVPNGREFVVACDFLAPVVTAAVVPGTLW